MRIVLLALALLTAGCVADTEPLTTASTDEGPPPPEPPAPPPEPEPQPVPTTPPPSSPPPTEPTPASPPTPPTPPPPPDHHVEQEGWVQAAPPPGMAVRIPFPVLEGAKNVTVRVTLLAVSPAGAPPMAPGNASASLVGPDGAALANASSAPTDAQPTARIELSGPFTPGEHAAVLSLVGASDGQQAGHRYRAVVHVAY